jgi:hypothetical protein
MTNANPLATLNKGATQLTELEQLILAEAAQEQAAFDLIPTKLVIAPGGMNVFKASTGEVLSDISAIVAISQKARAYWPEKGSGQAPMCASLDGSQGVVNPNATDAQMRAATTAHDPHPVIRLSDNGQPLPSAYDCAICPLAQWGSTHQNGAGKGQACKTLRRLVVLIDGWMQPALLTLPPTSIKNFDAYASGMAQKRSAYWAVRTRIMQEARKSNSGDPYSVAVFSADGALSADQLKAVIEVRRQYADLVRSMEIVSDEYDDTTPAPTDPEVDSMPF